MSNYMSKPTLAKPMNRIAAFILDTVLFLILFTSWMCMQIHIFYFPRHFEQFSCHFLGNLYN